MSRDLAQLAIEANKHHAEAVSLATSWLDEAILVGEALVEARSQVERGGWIAWCQENLDFSRALAHTYIRTFLHQDSLRSEGAVSSGAVYAALTGSTSGFQKGTPIHVPRETIRYIKKRRAEGESWRQIGIDLGHSGMTVRGWVDPQYRAEQRTATRQALRKRAAAKKALELQEERRLVKQVGGDFSVAYEHIRKAALALNAVGLHEAEGLCHRVEDMIVTAIKDERVSA